MTAATAELGYSTTVCNIELKTVRLISMMAVGIKGETWCPMGGRPQLQ